MISCGYYVEKIFRCKAKTNRLMALAGRISIPGRGAEYELSITPGHINQTHVNGMAAAGLMAVNGYRDRRARAGGEL
jgi:hypothetical protein